MKKGGGIKMWLVEGVKALFTGAAMIVPGMSGGTTALVLGFYDKLVDAASNIFKNFKKHIVTLAFYGGLIVGGFLLFSGVMARLMGVAPLPVFSFFTGAILGGLPLILKKAKTSPLKIYDALFPLAGAGVVYLLSLIPGDALAGAADLGLLWYVILLVAGVFLAAALVLPGISFSHMLLVLGIYEPMVTAIKELDILYLLPIGVSVLVGIFVVVKLLDRLMKKHPKPTFLTVLGFVAASAAEVAVESTLPLVGGIWAAIICVLFAGLGFGAIYFISLKEGAEE